jgi:hypothetical protein
MLTRAKRILSRLSFIDYKSIEDIKKSRQRIKLNKHASGHEKRQHNIQFSVSLVEQFALFFPAPLLK